MILEHLKKKWDIFQLIILNFWKRCNGLTLYHSGDYCLFDACWWKFFRRILVMIIYYVGRHGKLILMGYDIVINVDDIEKEYLYAGTVAQQMNLYAGNILNFIEEIVKMEVIPTDNQRNRTEIFKNNFKVKYLRQLIRYRTEDGIVWIVGT